MISMRRLSCFVTLRERLRLRESGKASSVRVSSKQRISEFFLSLIALAMVLTLAGGLVQGQEPEGVSIRGRVVDEGRLPVVGAEVLCKRESDAFAIKTISAQDGDFSFSDLKAGVYSLVAAKGENQSAKLSLAVSGSKPLDPVEMILAAGSGSKDKPAQPMEFADAPSFTIAGVTDWTAAGGHGSDATLRTSEALNRETLSLRPNNGVRREESFSPSSSPDTEAKLRSALSVAPESFDLNRQMGEFYLRQGRYAESLPFFQKASANKSGDATNDFDLASAWEGVGDPVQARRHIEPLLQDSANAGVHRLAGEIYEKDGEPLLAVHEFARAVQLDPSENNYFEWGSELLYHRAVWQAKQVFEQGVRVYPTSVRLLTSLGSALFAGALYDEAETTLCTASDLNPDNSEPYVFMGKIELASPHPLECVTSHLKRFAKLHPEDPLSAYFYAMALWKQHGDAIDGDTRQQIVAYLTKAISIDPRCSDAYLQLGNLDSLLTEYPKAIEFYRKAVETNPASSEAHYRLAIAYGRTGERAKAKQEFALHDEIEKQEAARVENQRKAIKQFIVDVSKSGDQ
jgi:tetratricopeptide (TPR) repeat protein